jgi:hypothetical protein
MVAKATRSNCARNKFLRAIAWRPSPLRGFHSIGMTKENTRDKARALSLVTSRGIEPLLPG